MSLKKKRTFDELVSENRQQILKDRSLMDKIEKQLELKRKPIQKEVQ
ncbi:FbpB family small basic protein [Virgibacillus sp. AGTR]|uniref:FbpB family small basic protein n=1 Tax=Virgibacillus salarius TaxID=447199 RepID=A0A941DW21_9BACI|nr:MULTISPECIES: FbpB family small basic protein [Bacillaceae]MCC2249681.1 FbpB family small basic protein [Virgibacillus sp. AGTR]NAZ08877.1 FbpB family small basic protein [Agaribacter marinus]MBR7796169.1 FbpB family small basic protein [Virgibacillus salarius]QRZ20217.1 FbpB family small basic protein [Virgibacillus sp. AGTR]WBX82293.1 FbpB family small basic protein [Virgibacillus salarius]